MLFNLMLRSPLDNRYNVLDTLLGGEGETEFTFMQYGLVNSVALIVGELFLCISTLFYTGKYFLELFLLREKKPSTNFRNERLLEALLPSLALPVLVPRFMRPQRAESISKSVGIKREPKTHIFTPPTEIGYTITSTSMTNLFDTTDMGTKDHYMDLTTNMTTELSETHQIEKKIPLQINKFMKGSLDKLIQKVSKKLN
ncbi:hypothetical protein SNEBB_007014 [Seison nebaliae]|nr:hypothetical protein SNEBB_007014 [Seison nebaliae]